jgi:Ran GTPase-activating protein (RanGAP) involved in mRNA processing and transport
MSSAEWTVGSIAELVRRLNGNYAEEVWMRNVQINDRNAGYIADTLITCTAISELWLSNCDILDGGAAEFARVLRNPKCSLKFLNLSGNEISDQGAAALFEALEANTGLEALFLNENRIGDEAASALARMLGKNRTLQEVYLWDNRLTDKGCSAIASALMLNKTVVKCEIDNGDEDETNAIEDKEIVQTIRTYCDRNASLQTEKLIKRNPRAYRRTTREVADFEKV